MCAIAEARDEGCGVCDPTICRGWGIGSAVVGVSRREEVQVVYCIVQYPRERVGGVYLD
jgi:hypothetical protein